MKKITATMAVGVYISPESAEYDPGYVRLKSFRSQAEAEVYAEEMRSFL